MVSETPESSSSFSSSSAPKSYDVFLSFRGDDIRKTFLGHLYNALVNAGIDTFKDDKNMESGEEIGPSLLMAIKESRIAIPVFSADYASSTWCLDELVHIMDCKEKFDQTVLPIFFSVDPSDIRKQKGSFEKAFSNHEEKLEKNYVDRWREALRKAANLSGLTLQQVRGDEAELIKLVVSEILSKLNSIAHLDVTNHLVGIDSHVESVMNLLNVDSTKASFVGICGMGGLGKTTIAKDVFNRIFRCFDGSSFIDDVRESSKQGRVNLQNILLSNIIKEHPNITSVSRGITVIKDRLHCKKVLIVLDDVDDKNQLESLAGEPDWFGPGSKVVITTRDESVLKGKGIRIYRPKELDLTQSLVLFSKHAFRSDQPEEDFTDISKEIVHISGGLPLALQVLGSSLSDTRVRRDWESRLDSLKKSPVVDVKKKLEISYEVLGREEKEMFLDVACFFIGMQKETAIVIWEGCGFSSTYGINVLIYKSLVKIGDYNELRMHDQLRDMGREIIRERSHQGPGTYSRLWDHEEALDVLEQDIGTTNVQGFALHFDGFRNKVSSPTTWKEGCLNSKNFAKMSQLRLLQVDNAHLVGVFKRFPRELRWLRWWGCPLDFIPKNIPLGKLVVLDLSWSNIRQVWSDKHKNQMATKLKILNLSSCKYLARTPDFSQHPDLERLDLSFCPRLVEVDKSIGNLRKTLKFLNLEYCSNLRELPSSLFTLEYVEELDLSWTAIEQLPDSIGNLKNLTMLSLKSCRSLKKLPDSVGKLESLRELKLSSSSVEQVPVSIGSLKNLTMLSLEGCCSLKKLPDSLGKLESLRELILSSTSVEQVPVSIRNLKNLEILRASSCDSLCVLPDSIGDLKSLSRLELDGTLVHELPSSIGSLSKLKCLSLSHCRHLTKIPDSIWSAESLIELILDHTQITEVPDFCPSQSKLEKLLIRQCKSFSRLPDSIGYARNLTSLEVNGTIIKELPNSLGNLESLRKLALDDTPIENIPVSIGYLKKLEILGAKWCHSLTALPDSIGDLESLLELKLDGTPILNLPHSIGSLLKLQVLSLTGCRSLSEIPDSVGSNRNLTTLEIDEVPLTELPNGIGSLEKLEELSIGKCKKLVKLPESMGRLKLLKNFKMGETGIVEFPEDFGMMHSLETLEMDGCQEFRGFPENFGSLARLKVLNVRRNSKLIGLPNSFSDLRSLKEVNASHCNLLDGGMPSDLGRLSSLVTLMLGHNNFCSLPDSINDLSKLQYLYLPNCRKLEYLLELPSGLWKLDVGNCISLERLPNLSNLKYLHELTLANCEKIKEIEGIDSLKFLIELSMIGCNMNRNTLRNIFVQEAFLNFSFPGSQIPTWFTPHQEVTFVVGESIPQQTLTYVAHGGKLDWLVICIVFALVEDVVDEDMEDMYQNDESPFLAYIDVLISGSKCKNLKIRGIPKAHQDQVIMLFYKLGSFHIEEGTRIRVAIKSKPRIQVKNAGVHLVYKNTPRKDIYKKLADFFTTRDAVGAPHSVSIPHKE